MLWQHQAAEPIGVWTSIVEDSRGLKVEGRLDLSVARAREALSLMRNGAIDGLSIGFRTRRATTEKSSGVRRLHEIDLWEISIVTFPMLPQARIGAVKQSRSGASRMEALGAKLSRLKAQQAALEFAQALRRLPHVLTAARERLHRSALLPSGANRYFRDGFPKRADFIPAAPAARASFRAPRQT